MAYNQQDNRNPNRLQLNFGGGGGYPPGQQPPNFSAEQARGYPTTPSTFPQPFPNAAGQQEVWGTQTPGTGVNQQGYFSNINPYGNQFQQNMPSPAYRMPNAGFNDLPNGFAQQMNLGGNTPRSASPAYRTASPANPSRPRTAGNSGQPYPGYLNAPMPGQQPQPSIFDDQAPPKNSEKYSAFINERVRHQKMLTGEFFKESVERAKTRNERFVLVYI